MAADEFCNPKKFLWWTYSAHDWQDFQGMNWDLPGYSRCRLCGKESR